MSIFFVAFLCSYTESAHSVGSAKTSEKQSKILAY